MPPPEHALVRVADQVRYRLSQGFLTLLATSFVLQILSPLRLNTDAIVLLSMGDSAAHGGGFLDSGQKTVFPPGYPALLAVLMRVGLAHPWSIVGLNALFLSAGLFATYSLLIREFFKDKAIVLTICSFFLLSFVVVKHFPIPLTDVPFFCCSMCCLAVVSKTTNIEWSWRFVILAVAAWLLAMTAITIRRVGVVLIPSLVFMIAQSPSLKSLLHRLSRRATLVIVAASMSMGVGTILVVAKTSSLLDFLGLVRKSQVLTLVFQIISYRLTEFGELLTNLPMSKTPKQLHLLEPCVGVVLLLLTLIGVAAKRRNIGPTEVFLLCYMGIMFVWPYYDARFWLPALPLLIAYSVLAIKSLRFPKSVVMMYCIVFSSLGFLAIAYSTRLSFAGSAFPDRYGDGNLRPTYCAAFESCRDSGDPDKVNAKVLHLIRDYN